MPITSITNKTTSKQFEDKYKNGKVILIYHWNSCGHCLELMPRLKNILDNNSDLRNNSDIFTIELSYLQLLPNELTNISFFPCIICYNNEKIEEEFKGLRTDENLISFIKKNSKSTSRPQTYTKSKTSSIRVKKLLKDYNSFYKNLKV